MASYCLGILNEGKPVEHLNLTNIVLILKVPNPTSLGNFRPISLCNVIYKIVTKMIVNCFKHVLVHCIDNSQSSFILGRLISDNILIAYEILHTFHQKRIEKRVYGSQGGYE